MSLPKNPLDVTLRDTNGDYVAVGGGTQYSDGDANADPTGTVAMGTDGSNIFAVATDTSGHLQVDVLSGGGDGAINDGFSSTIKATVLDYVGSNPLAVRLTDTDGNYVGAGAGTQYADGAARGTAIGTLAMGDDGTLIQSLKCDANGVLAIQDNGGSITVDGTLAVTNAGITSIDGKITACNTGAVVVSSGTITAITSITNAVAVTGTFWQATQPVSIAATVTVDTELPAAAALSDIIANPTAPMVGAALMGYDVAGAVWERLITDASGRLVIADGGTAISIDDNAGSITVDGTFWQATQPISAASLPLPTGAATSANQTTIIGHIDGIEGLLTTIDVDTGSIATSATSIDGKITACNTGAVVVASGAITADLGVNNDIQGDIAHDAADSGNPVKTGHKAVLFDGSAPPNAAVAEGDRTNSISDEYGRQYVETTHPNYWSVSADYAVAQTNASIKIAPGVGLSLYLTDIVISNGATAGNITLLNGSAGTVVYEIYPAINGGSVHSLRTPIKLTANTALCCTSTTVTTFSVTISGFVAP